MSQGQPQAPALLWGVKEIAGYIRRSERQTYYLIEENRIPVRRLGPKTIVASPAEIDASLKSASA